MTGPSLAALLAELPDDPPAAWPRVPDRPAHPGPGWTARPTEGTRHPVWTSTSGHDDPARAWLAHRGDFARTGLWPLLVADRFWEAVELAPVARGADVRRGTTSRDLLAGLVGDQGYEPEREPLPDVTPTDRPLPDVVTELAGMLAEPCDLVLVPTRAPWLVPELLGWDGAVNHDVLGPEHTAVLGRWHGLFGAEPVGLTRDVLVLLVTRPPTEPAARLSAAAEVYAYCPDSVDQGVGSLEELTEMTARPEWIMWWD